MNILKEIAPQQSLPRSSSRFRCPNVILSLCLFLSGVSVYAQNEKQISYPVAVPIERAAASSAAPTPVIKAPEPVIRPIEEASTTPPPPNRKASTKKTKTDTAKKATAKVETTKVEAAAEKSSRKKATPNKSTSKQPTKPAPVKTTAVPSVKKAEPAPVTSPSTFITEGTQQKASLEKPLPEQTAAAVASKTPQNLNDLSLKAAAVPLAAVATKTSFAMDEEEQLGNNFLDETESLSPEPVTPAVTKTPSAIKNSSLPMSNQREAFVTEFKNYVETKVAPRVPGLAVAVIADGKVTVLETYGLKKVGTKEQVNADTLFRLASVSKSFGSSVAAMLVNDGLISWDTTVRSILPEVEFSNPRYGDQLTVRNILSQSTGLPTQTNTNFIEDGLPFDEVVRRLRYVNFVCPPGKCYNYQNVTYSLISNIVLKKTGRTYEDYLQKKIFAPLGMRTATVGFAGLKAANNYALPHVPTRKGWYSGEVTENYYRVNPAAGVNASITDMSRWLLAQMGQNPDVLSPEILNAVHAKVTRNTPAQNHYGSREGVTDSHYGLGWRVFDYRGDKNFVHHGGGVMGFRSEMVFNPELKIGMVVLTNSQRLSGDIIFEFLDAYEDEKRGERRKPAAAAQSAKKKK